jgi:MFS family permease
MGSFCGGAVMGWTSYALPYLQNPLADFNRSGAYSYTVVGNFSSALGNISAKNETAIEGVTGSQASWIASLAPLGALVGAMSAGYVANAIGRKNLLLFLAMVYISGWSIIIAAGRSVSEADNVSYRYKALMQ